MDTTFKVFDRHGILSEPADVSDPAQLLRAAHRVRGFAWIHFSDPDGPDLLPWADGLDLHPLAVEQAVSGDQQPTFQGFGEQLSVVLWAPLDEDGVRLEAVPMLFLFLGPRFILTVVRNDARGVFNLEQRFAGGAEYLRAGPAGALYVVLATLVEHFTAILARTERELGRLGAEVFDQAAVDDAARLYRLRQRLGRLERPLSSLVHSVSRTPDSLHRVIDQHSTLAPYLTDALDDLLGLGDLIADQRGSLDTVIASHENNVAQRQNSDMRRISAYGALLAVPTVIAGLYGMNFKDLPGVDWSFGYAAVAVAVLLIDAVIFIAFKRRHWL